MRRHKKYALILAGAMLLTSVTGCGKQKEETTTEATTKAEVTTEAATETTTEAEATTEEAGDNIDYANMTAEELVAKIKDPANPTVEEYAWLCSTFQYVEINDELELEENITDEALSLVGDAIYDGDGQYPDMDGVFDELIKSEAPQVRGYALSLTYSFVGVSDEGIAVCKEMIANEKDPYVIKCLVSALSNEVATDPEIANFIIEMSENENAAIRYETAAALANAWSKGVDGVVDAVIRLMNDEDEDVCDCACSGAGQLRDEAVIEPLVAILNDPEKANIHGSAVTGLVDMWFDYPFHEGTSEAAYNATMDYWKKKPRTEEVPCWTSVTEISVRNKDKFDAWKQNATYFNEDDVIAVMYDILMDPDVNWLARSGALDTIFEYATPEYCKGLQSAIDGLTDDKAELVQSAYQNKIDKMASE